MKQKCFDFSSNVIHFSKEQLRLSPVIQHLMSYVLITDHEKKIVLRISAQKKIISHFWVISLVLYKMVNYIYHNNGREYGYLITYLGKYGASTYTNMDY